VTAEH
jgi:hypothetical protein